MIPFIDWVIPLKPVPEAVVPMGVKAVGDIGETTRAGTGSDKNPFGRKDSLIWFGNMKRLMPVFPFSGDTSSVCWLLGTRSPLVAGSCLLTTRRFCAIASCSERRMNNFLKF